MATIITLVSDTLSSPPPSMDTLLALERDSVLYYSIVSTLLAVTVTTFLALGKSKPKPALDPIEFRKFELVSREDVSHDTRRFTFSLGSPATKLGLPVGQHISFRFTDAEGKNHQRSYTPVTGDETPGIVSFVIKIYKAGVHPKFPEGGKMSQHLDSLKVGDRLEMKGPKGHMEYLGRGKFTVKKMRKPLSYRTGTHFGMIAGGTGITPMLQVIHAVLRDPSDKTTKISLLYANQTEDDILVRDELDTLARDHPDRFRLHYTVDRPPVSGWKYSKGFVTKDMIEGHLPKVSKTTHVLMCGPPPMIKFACLPALKELGFDDEQLFSF